MSTSTTQNQQHQGSVKSYVTGLILSLVLTAIPFSMVMSGTFSKVVVVAAISVMALLQVILQLTLFMHLNLKTKEGRESGGSLFFTAVTITLIIGGSVWIMHHLHINLM